MKFSDEQLHYLLSFDNISDLKKEIVKEIEINQAISYYTEHWEISLLYPDMKFCELVYMDKHIADNDSYVFRGGIQADIEKGEYQHTDELITLINHVKQLLK